MVQLYNSKHFSGTIKDRVSGPVRYASNNQNFHKAISAYNQYPENNPWYSFPNLRFLIIFDSCNNVKTC